jgi:uncharacterized protein (TIGR02453 family)
MLQTKTVKFLSELAHNNNKNWFDANREVYADAKEDFEIFVAEVLKGLAITEPIFAEQKAKDCVFRIFRDVRFAKDKTPYKPNFGAAFSKGGRKSAGAGYYLHVEPDGKSFVGGGIWMPEAPVLKKIRQEIDYNFNDFIAVITQADFEIAFGGIQGEQVKTLPKGYQADNPAIEFLKFKSYTVHHNVEDKSLTGKHFATEVVGLFNTMKPFIDFLNRGVSE